MGEKLPALASVTVALLLAPLVWAHPGAGIVVDKYGQVFFVDQSRNRILKLAADGKITTLMADGTGEQIPNPHHLAIDEKGNLYTAGDANGKVWRITPHGRVMQHYPPTDRPNDRFHIDFVGRWGDPFTMDPQGNIYCVNQRQGSHCQILKISPNGRIVSLAGNKWGYADGKADEAQFGNLHGGAMIVCPNGLVYLTDDSRRVRKIAPDGTVSTLAGGKQAGAADGRGIGARFDGAYGLALDQAGNVYVADSGNRRIRKISPAGVVSTLAGPADSSSMKGQAVLEIFAFPCGVAVGPNGDVYVLDYGKTLCIHKISPDGKVTMVAAVE